MTVECGGRRRVPRRSRPLPTRRPLADLDAAIPAVLLVGVIVLCSLLVWNLVALHRASYDVARLEQELRREKVRIEESREAIDRLPAPDGRESQLDADMGLVRPDEVRYVIVSPSHGSRP